MKSVDLGILPKSCCFTMTPSEQAKKLYFYPTWCGHYFCTNSYFMRRQKYQYLLILFVRNGMLHVEYRGESVNAQRGDIVLLDCSEPHYYHATDGLEFLYMHYDGSNAREITLHIIDALGWHIQRETNLMIGKLLYDMVEFYENGGIESMFASSIRIYRIFEFLLTPTAQEHIVDNPIEDAMHYVRDNISKPITLTEMARVANLSIYYFSHCFKRQTGFSPIEYVIDMRMNHAKASLIRTAKSVTEIAYEVGYSSSGSFINQFIKYTGQSPKQYRKTRHPPQESGECPSI